MFHSARIDFAVAFNRSYVHPCKYAKRARGFPTRPMFLGGLEMKHLANYVTHHQRNWNCRSLAVALTVAGLTLFGLRLTAQSGAGSIQGTVTDATGAVIPGATIHV